MSEKAATPTRTRWRAVTLLFAVAVIVCALDQLLKIWAVRTLPAGETVPILGEMLRWHLVRNSGSAFSIASDATWVFTLVSAVVACLIVLLAKRVRALSWAIFLGLLLGGVLGNLGDRLLREPGFPVGHVVDFISTPWLWLGFNEAIYNFADMSIVAAMLTFIFISLRGIALDGTRQSAAGRRNSKHENQDGTS